MKLGIKEGRKEGRGGKEKVVECLFCLLRVIRQEGDQRPVSVCHCARSLLFFLLFVCFCLCWEKDSRTGPFLEEELDSLKILLGGGEHERVLPLDVLEVGIGPILEEQLGDLGGSVVDGRHQSCPAFRVLVIDIGSLVEEHSDELSVVSGGSNVKGRDEVWF